LWFYLLANSCFLVLFHFNHSQISMRKLYRPLLTAACLGLSLGAFAQGNLLPNASFEDQKVTPSGNRNNVLSASAPRDELAAWRSTNNGTPDYLATNAPAGSETDPFNYTATWGYVQPYNYNSSLHNGMVGLFAYGGYTPLESEYITPDSGPLNLAAGAYYAAFRASKSTYSTSFSKLGMNLTLANPVTTTSSGYYSRATTSIESPGFITGNAWSLVSGTITIPAAGQYYVNIGNFDANSHGGSTASDYVYYFVDEVQLFKIPAANPNKSSLSVPCGTSVRLGESSSIPNASYAWTVTGSTTPFATTSQVTVNPTATTTYTLTVTLPDGSTSVSTATITATPPAMPQVQAPDWTCVDGSRGPVFVYVDDYNPAYTYNITTTKNIVVFGGATITSITDANGTTRWRFQIRSTVAGGTGTVSVKATNSCGNNTTTFNVTSPSCSAASGVMLAYPNPARESLTVPGDVKKATLLNNQGRAVQQSDASGKLNVQSLPDGLYNLQMQQDGRLINQRIEVKH
jgi:hypothetical protein